MVTPSLPNPYNTGLPIEDSFSLFGREYELTRLTDLSYRTLALSIVAPRRMGRTSLLRVASKLPIPKSTQIVEINCQAAPRNNPNEFFDHMFKSLYKEGAPPPLGPTANPWDVLQTQLQNLKNRGVRVAFFLDEFESLTDSEQLDAKFYENLRSLLTAHLCSLITSTEHTLYDLTKDKSIHSSPFFNVFNERLYLRVLQPAAAMATIMRPSQRVGIEVPFAFARRIIEQVGFYPFLLQLYGHSLFERFKNTGSFNEGMFSEAAAEAQRTASQHVNYWWGHLSDTHRSALEELVEHGAAKNVIQEVKLKKVAPIILKELDEWGWIIRYQGNVVIAPVFAEPKGWGRPSKVCLPDLQREISDGLRSIANGLAEMTRIHRIKIDMTDEEMLEPILSALLNGVQELLTMKGNLAGLDVRLDQIEAMLKQMSRKRVFSRKVELGLTTIPPFLNAATKVEIDVDVAEEKLVNAYNSTTTRLWDLGTRFFNSLETLLYRR